MGEDEIGFRKGEIIVVIARDDGFDDGWWTVTPRHSLFLSFPPFFALKFVSFSRDSIEAWVGEGWTLKRFAHAYVETNGCLIANQSG